MIQYKELNILEGKMDIFDISLYIYPGLPVWPGDPQVQIERVAKIEEGANANVSHIKMGLHTGTHVDSPVHFLPDGAGVESLSLHILTGKAYVLHIPGDVNIISARHLEGKIPEGVERLLLRTKNSTFWEQKDGIFHTDFTGMDKSGAEVIVQRGIRLVGIDYLSIAPYKKSRPTHEVLLKNNVIILEGLNLTGIEEGFYTLYCLPLKIPGVDGAPARAILVK